MAITKPAVRATWGDTAVATTDIIDPDTVTPGFVSKGWQLSSVPPSRQYFNWLLNYCFNGVRYLSRRGVPDWDAEETYELNDVVMSSDGIVRQSLAFNNIGNAPPSSPSLWSGLYGYALSGVLGGYVTTTQLNTALSNYVTTSTFNSTLSNYATTGYANLVQNNAITASVNYTNSALGNYFTSGQVNSILTNYVTATSLNSALLNYPTNAAFNATLANYASLNYLNGNFWPASYISANFYTAGAVESRIQAYLASYYSAAQVNSIFSGYYTVAQVQSIIGAYYTAAQVNSIVSVYDTVADVNNKIAGANAYALAQANAARGNFGNGGVNGISNALFGNGLQVRFGYSPANTGNTRNIAFPAFSNNIIWAMACNGEFSSGLTAVGVILVSPGEIQLITGASGGGMYWIAFGY